MHITEGQINTLTLVSGHNYLLKLVVSMLLITLPVSWTLET